MTIKVGAAGGGFVTKFVSASQVVASGASGDLITLTPPAGQKVKLTSLVAFGVEALISITVNAVNVVTTKSLNSGDSVVVDQFSVGAANNTGGEIADQEAISGGTDEVIIVKKDSGTTGVNINFSYQFGE